jgi:GTP pyrophosphokinase
MLAISEFQQAVQNEFASYPDVDQDLLLQYISPIFNLSIEPKIPYNIDPLLMGLEISKKILLCSKVGEDTLATSILFPAVYFSKLSTNKINDVFAPPIAKALLGVLKMDMVPIAASSQPRFRQSLDNMRKLMLAMVDDFRIVLIKLAERLVVLLHLRDLPEPARLPIALEIQKVYAPLANRMGIGYLKWQLEDLSFRYINPDEYKRLSQGLRLKRVEREQFVDQVIAICTFMLEKNGIKNFSISGRAKHIYSIYKKLILKNKKEVSALFDTTAVRVLVDTIEDCYEVLGFVTKAWIIIPEEFDDYIAHPKSNGYQSIHVAVWGPEDRCVEIQIRTYAMHKAAEGGIASHWAYKENNMQEDNYQQKIDALRDLMNWQSSLVVDTTSADEAFKELFSDRAYVFTPNGDVVDLPVGSTPLDFAYSVHTEVGNRCRGSKVNGKLVPLTYQLRTGELVEILIDKQGIPSRDWLDVHKKYLFTHRARNKVAHYFKQHDVEKNLLDGKAIVEKMQRKHVISKAELIKALDAFNFKSLDELYIAVGTGAIGATTLQNRVRAINDVEVSELPIIENKSVERPYSGKYPVIVEGLGATETVIAQCCKPISGDPIIGYIVKERGVVIHHAECANIINSMNYAPDKILTVHWNSDTVTFIADLSLQIVEQLGALNIVMQVISAAKINIVNLKANVMPIGNSRVDLSVEVVNADQLEALMRSLRGVPAVISVWRC